jgi:hypothetical protein
MYRWASRSACLMPNKRRSFLKFVRPNQAVLWLVFMP